MRGGHFVDRLLQLNTIFISIVIEAIPFIVIGALISALIEVFVSENMIIRMMPKNRFLSVITASLLGVFFPGCECGIVPIASRLIKKGVAPHAAISFMLAAPIINPIVLFATFIAFGESWTMVWYRAGLALGVSILVGIFLSFVIKENPLKDNIEVHVHNHSKQNTKHKLISVVTHTIDEFLSVGKFLVMGSLIAASMQVYVPTKILLTLGDTKVTAILVMMGLAFILSICSEADAFVASSFRNSFGQSSLVAFLVFGAMLDIKNILMMTGYFQKRLIIVLVSLISVFVFIGALLL
ncbi:permease [Neobacillus sp. MM2021_6]|uniref:permease n=1 Tax=Bacillaceae TaxID=186817 RepID=UPI00140AE8B3|nr:MULTISPECIES: permease [Bacillaceae]MBO0961282.1 permease [Neobacillus sp. MM2021_6]NHC21514.1 permease [Bacillus sp. MM2020_4]